MPEGPIPSISEINWLEEQLLSAMRDRDLFFLEKIFSDKYVFMGSDGSGWGKVKALEDFKNPDYQLEKWRLTMEKSPWPETPLW